MLGTTAIKFPRLRCLLILVSISTSFFPSSLLLFILPGGTALLRSMSPSRVTSGQTLRTIPAPRSTDMRQRGSLAGVVPTAKRIRTGGEQVIVFFIASDRSPHHPTSGPPCPPPCPGHPFIWPSGAKLHPDPFPKDRYR